MRHFTGKNITEESKVIDVWNCINDILKPENTFKTTIKIETDDKVIDDPHELAEKFNLFFKSTLQSIKANMFKIQLYAY